MTKQRNVGNDGEALAVQHLSAAGYTILGQNWRCRAGEIDIIARTGEMLVFVEVKTRHAESTEAAFASITAAKRDRLIAAAHEYLLTHADDETVWRIDVIAVALPRRGMPVIEHQEDALGW